MKALRSWSFSEHVGSTVVLELEIGCKLILRVLEDTLIRVTLLRDNAYRLNRTWAIAPNGDTPWEGRLRDDLSGFSCPTFSLSQGDQQICIETEKLRLTVRTPLALLWKPGFLKPVIGARSLETDHKMPT